MRNRAITRGVRNVYGKTHASAYVGHWRLTEQNGDGGPADISGNGQDMALGSSLVEANVWGDNFGRMTLPGRLGGTGDGKDYSAQSGAAYPTIDWTAHTLIVSLLFKQAAADNATVAADILGAGGNAGNAGWRIRVNQAGGLEFFAHDTSTAYLSTATGNLDDDSEHHVLLAFDGTTDEFSYWTDGTLTVEAESLAGCAAALAAVADSFQNFGIGATIDNSGVHASPGVFGDVQLLHVSGGLPANIGDMINKLRTRPHVALTDADIG